MENLFMCFKGSLMLLALFICFYFLLLGVFSDIKNKREKRKKLKEKEDKKEVYEKFYVLDKRETTKGLKRLRELHKHYFWFHSRNKKEENTDYATDYTTEYTMTETEENEEHNVLDEILQRDINIDAVDLSIILTNIHENHKDNLVCLKEKTKENK